MHCQAIITASKGKSYYGTAKEIGCPIGASILGLKEIPEKILNGSQFDKMNVTSTQESGKALIDSVPKNSSKIEAIGYMPLEDSKIKAISTSDTMLFIGWAVIEGIAGALMTPATVSIISGTYSGEKRTFALAIESIMVALSAAVGPIFGGIMTTFLSWRYGFACELIIVIFILLMQNKIPDFTPTESKDDLDITGTIISFIGLVLFVLGILIMSEDATISVVVIILGIIALAVFALFEIRRKRNGKVPLLDMDLFKDKNLRIGSSIIVLSYIVNDLDYDYLNPIFTVSSIYYILENIPELFTVEEFKNNTIIMLTSAIKNSTILNISNKINAKKMINRLK